MKAPYLTIFMLMFFCGSLRAQQKIRIACIGNSITYGYLVPNRERNAYPAQLQAMLGDNYEVMNFGSSGKTALHQGGNPYIETKQYHDALASKADIFLIKLGTNDSRPFYRKYIDSFYYNYRELVRTFKALPNHPKVILMTPVVNFLKPAAGDPYNMDLPKYIIPMIRRVAEEEECELIDLHPLLIGHPEMYTDKLHPDSAGAHIIADQIYRFLVQAKRSGALYRQSAPLPGNANLFNGNVPKLWKRSHNVYSNSEN